MASQTDVARYAAEHSSTTELLSSGKLQFTKTGMEFAPTTPCKVLEAYAAGRSYKRVVELRASEGYEFAQHEPYIVKHKHRDDKHFLYCKLTDSTLPRRKEVVVGHVSGKRFQRQLKNAERTRAEAKRIEEKRKERQEKQRLAGRKKRDDRKGADEGGEENGEGAEAPDLLGGILSDDDDDMKDGEEDASAGEEDEEMGDDGKDALDERMDEDEKEDAVFWTRGRHVAPSADGDDDDDGDDEGKPPRGEKKTGVTTRKSKTRAKSSKKATPSPVVDMDQDGEEDQDPSSVKAAKGDTVAGKRPRTEKVPKKVRRPRQRRKASRAETPTR